MTRVRMGDNSHSEEAVVGKMLWWPIFFDENKTCDRENAWRTLSVTHIHTYTHTYVILTYITRVDLHDVSIKGNLVPKITLEPALYICLVAR